jgi:hypothetical protein
MTVRELRVLLANENADSVMIIQKDAEGNSYSPLSGLDGNAGYEAETASSGSVGVARLTPVLQRAGFAADDLGSGVPCVVLYPKR